MSTATAAAADATPRRGRRVADLARNGVAAWMVVAVAVVGLTVADGARFWAPANIATVLTATVVLGLVALGEHVVVLSGGIDLSVGSMATLLALLTAVLVNGDPIRTGPVLVAVVALGAPLGAGDGVLVAGGRRPPVVGP